MNFTLHYNLPNIGPCFLNLSSISFLVISWVGMLPTNILEFAVDGSDILGPSPLNWSRKLITQATSAPLLKNFLNKQIYMCFNKMRVAFYIRPSYINMHTSKPKIPACKQTIWLLSHTLNIVYYFVTFCLK